MSEVCRKECSKFWKNDHFLVFSVLWVFLPKFLCRLTGVSHIVPYPIFFSFVLWARIGGKSVQSYEKWSIFSFFSCLGSFPQVLRNVKEWLKLEFHETITVPHIAPCAIVFILLYDGDLAGRSTQTYEKWSFFSVFSCLGPFPQIFAQFKGWLKLKLHKIIKDSHVVACPIVFVLFYGRDFQGRVLKLMRVLKIDKSTVRII